jgi:hypothetical protein
LRNLGEGTEENSWWIAFEHNYPGTIDKMMLTATVKDCPEDLFEGGDTYRTIHQIVDLRDSSSEHENEDEESKTENEGKESNPDESSESDSEPDESSESWSSFGNSWSR